MTEPQTKYDEETFHRSVVPNRFKTIQTHYLKTVHHGHLDHIQLTRLEEQVSYNCLPRRIDFILSVRLFVQKERNCPPPPLKVINEQVCEMLLLNFLGFPETPVNTDIGNISIKRIYSLIDIIQA